MVLITLQDDDGYPSTKPSRETECLVCGHCVAVCPTGSLSHAEVPVEVSPPIKKELRLTEAQAEQFLRSRRSIRSFKDKKVERAKIEKLIEIARYAPSGSNSQTVQWQVYTDRGQIDALASLAIDYLRHVIAESPHGPYTAVRRLMVRAWDMGIDALLWRAPALIIASAPKRAITGLADVVIALSYLELAAPIVGLGTCWLGLLNDALRSWSPLQEAVDLPADHVHRYPMALGYPKAKYYRLPERRTPNISWR